MSNQEHSNESGRDGLPDLSILADFQFGPSWARKGAETSAHLPEGRGMRDRRLHENGGGNQGERRRFREGDRADRGERRRFQEGDRRPEGRFSGKGRPDGRGHGFGGSDRRSGRFERGDRSPRPERVLPDPAPGLRVELRPADSVLNIFEQEVRKHKRAISAMELAKVVMAEKNRYDIVLMKLEDGSSMLASKKGDGACWLERREALDYLFRAPWFSEYYEAVQEDVEPPKGTFTAIAKCGFSGQLIGPVNWHGYQIALQTLHRNRFSNMSFERYRSRVVLEKSQEAIDAWIAQASHHTVWKPLREGASDLVLADEKAVEKDFEEHHFDEVYALEDKVFVNGATPRALLSPGLGAHVAILSDKTRRAPQMLIPNLCHGLARHKLAIFKWKGKHYTSVSRVRSIPADTVLADRMTAIVGWARTHQGQTADKMFAELSGVSDDDKERCAEAYAPYVADMIWLMEQGFILVMTDNTVWFPKNADQAPALAEKTKDAAEKAPEGKSASEAKPKSEGKSKPKVRKAKSAGKVAKKGSSPEASSAKASSSEAEPAVQVEASRISPEMPVEASEEGAPGSAESEKTASPEKTQLTSPEVAADAVTSSLDVTAAPAESGELTPAASAEPAEQAASVAASEEAPSEAEPALAHEEQPPALAADSGEEECAAH